MICKNNIPDIDTALSQIKEMSLVDFLGGPGISPERVIIDDIFAGTLETALKDMIADTAISIDLMSPKICHDWEILALSQDTIIVAPTGDDCLHPPGVLSANKSGDVTGAYVGCSLAVLPSHRGNGIGRDLVVCRYLMECELPLWQHDKPGFSTAGYATHRSAFEKLLSL